MEKDMYTEKIDNISDNRYKQKVYNNRIHHSSQKEANTNEKISKSN